MKIVAKGSMILLILFLALPAWGQMMGRRGGQQALTQTNQAGGVTVAVTYKGIAGERLTFEVKLDTHTVNLDEYIIEKISRLRNDKGLELRPLGWESPQGGGHHRSGLLVFPASDPSGKPIIDGGTNYIELIMEGIAGVKERVLRWELR